MSQIRMSGAESSVLQAAQLEPSYITCLRHNLFLRFLSCLQLITLIALACPGTSMPQELSRGSPVMLQAPVSCAETLDLVSKCKGRCTACMVNKHWWYAIRPCNCYKLINQAQKSIPAINAQCLQAFCIHDWLHCSYEVIASAPFRLHRGLKLY